MYQVRKRVFEGRVSWVVSGPGVQGVFEFDGEDAARRVADEMDRAYRAGAKSLRRTVSIKDAGNV